MGNCFGNYGSRIDCNSCKVKNSCQRVSKYSIRTHNSNTLINPIINILKRRIKPISTYRLRIELRNYYNYPISDYTLKEYMLNLKKRKLVKLRKTKKGRYWSAITYSIRF